MDMSTRCFFNFLCGSIIASSALVSGCALHPVGVIDGQAVAPGSTEAVVVHGMQQPEFRYVFVKGKIENGMFEQTKSVGALMGAPDKGYLVGKIEAGDVIALIQIGRIERQGNEQVSFRTGCGHPVRVFAVPGGKVSYLGDARVAITRNRELQVDYSANFQDAKNYVDSHFPALKDHLEPLASQVVPYKCPPSYQYYMIYK